MRHCPYERATAWKPFCFLGSLSIAHSLPAHVRFAVRHARNALLLFLTCSEGTSERGCFDWKCCGCLPERQSFVMADCVLVMLTFETLYRFA